MLSIFDHGEVRELRLARPPVNALDPDLIRALVARIEAAPREGARALVLSGAPGMFSAGLDVPHLLSLGRADIRSFWGDFFAVMRALANSPVPVAAAITGHSPAGGAVLSIFCDRRVMERGRWLIGFNEVRVGLPLPRPIHRALVHAAGERRAEQLGISGKLVDPEEAFRLGIVDALAEPGQAVADALAWCRDIVSLPAHALYATRALARAPIVESFDAVDDAFLDSMTDVWFSDATQTAMRALVERVSSRSRS